MNKKEIKEWNKYLKYSNLKPSKKELNNFLDNASEEDKLRNQLQSLERNINGAMLSTCEVYGLSGMCGELCPKYQDKTCECFEMEVNMSAKEMFREQGYEIDEESDKEILYKMKWEISSSYYVGFVLEDKTFECFVISDTPFEPVKSFAVDLDLYKAINKQIEELRWK